MKKILLFLIASVLFCSSVMAHVFEIRAKQAADGSITWYLISYHVAEQCAANTAGLIVNGTNYPISSVVNGDARPIAPILLAQDLNCFQSVNPNVTPPANLYVSYAIVNTPFLLPPLAVTPFSTTVCLGFCVGAVGNFVPPPTISFTATTTNGSTGSTVNSNPTDVLIDFCAGGSFTFSNYSSIPGVRVGALEKLESSGNVVQGVPVPANRPQSVIKPSEMAGFFGNTYGPYTLSSGSTGTITQHFTPFFDLNNNDVYDAGEVLGSTVNLHYTISDLTLAPCTKTDVLCNGASTGSIAAGLVTFNHGTVNYTWRNAANNVVGNTANVGGLPAGVYTLTVTDDCLTKKCTVTIEQPAALTYTYSFTPILCKGGLSKESITIYGGKAPYTVTNQGGGALVIGAQEGVTYNGNTFAAQYDYTITDANGCTKTFSVDITEPTQVVGGAISMSPNPTIAGHQVNTIFLGYGPQSVTLSTAPVSGGTPGYTYTWSPVGGSASTALVSPVTTTTYTVTIKDKNGCTITRTFTVKVIDARCGNKNDKVIVCHNGHEICISPNAVPAHLVHGCTVGPCTNTKTSQPIQPLIVVEASSKFNVFPSPTRGELNIQLPAIKSAKAEIVIINAGGNVIERRVIKNGFIGQIERFDLRRNGSGIYFIKIISEQGVENLKVVVQR